MADVYEVMLSLPLLMAGQASTPGLPATGDPILGIRTSVPSWEQLRGFYSSHPRRRRPRETVEHAGNTLIFRARLRDGLRVVFMRPSAPGRYPSVLCLHGLRGSKEQFLRLVGGRLLARGLAVIAIDAPFHGQRRTPEGDRMLAHMLAVAGRGLAQGDLAASVFQGDSGRAGAMLYEAIVEKGVRDAGVALDFLAARKDVDSGRIGVLGSSLGSTMAAILGGLDSRVGAVVLCVGGDPTLPLLDGATPEARLRLAAVSPSLFVSHFDGRPLLMVNAMLDKTVPGNAADRLFAAAGEPKKQVWYRGSHTLPSEALDQAAAWIAAYLQGQSTKNFVKRA